MQAKFAKLIVAALLGASFYSGYLYCAYVQNSNDKSEIPADQAVQIVHISSPVQTKLFALSSRFVDSSVKLSITGKDIVVKPAEAAWRGLSTSDRDPIATVTSVNSNKPISFKYFYEYHPGSPGKKPDDKFLYTLPYLTCSKFGVGQGYFGASHARGGISEYAVDFDLPENTLVCASRKGKVIALRDDSTFGGKEDKFNDSANFVIVRHEDESYAEYVHLKKNGALVKIGDQVEIGQGIALSGNTGKSSGPHLHFCVFYYDDSHQRHSLPVRFKTADGVNSSPQKGQVLAHPNL